jgi:hypothetical protein
MKDNTIVLPVDEPGPAVGTDMKNERNWDIHHNKVDYRRCRTVDTGRYFPVHPDA